MRSYRMATKRFSPEVMTPANNPARVTPPTRAVLPAEFSPVSYSQSLPIRLAMWWQRQQWYDELTASYVVVWVGIGGLAVLVLWALIEGGWL